MDNTKIVVKNVQWPLSHTPRKFSTHADNLLRLRHDSDDRAGAGYIFLGQTLVLHCGQTLVLHCGQALVFHCVCMHVCVRV